MVALPLLNVSGFSMLYLASYNAQFNDSVYNCNEGSYPGKATLTLLSDLLFIDYLCSKRIL